MLLGQPDTTAPIKASLAPKDELGPECSPGVPENGAPKGTGGAGVDRAALTSSCPVYPQRDLLGDSLANCHTGRYSLPSCSRWKTYLLGSARLPSELQALLWAPGHSRGHAGFGRGH